MILQVERDINRGTFALGKMIHLHLNTWFERLLRLYPNRLTQTQGVPLYPAILTPLDQQKLKKPQNKPTKMLLVVVF